MRCWCNVVATPCQRATEANAPGAQHRHQLPGTRATPDRIGGAPPDLSALAPPRHPPAPGPCWARSPAPTWPTSPWPWVTPAWPGDPAGRFRCWRNCRSAGRTGATTGEADGASAKWGAPALALWIRKTCGESVRRRMMSTLHGGEAAPGHGSRQAALLLTTVAIAGTRWW
jgi:hypothetical protein